MIDIRFLRENPDAVKENIRKKFQDAKLPLVDEVIALDEESRKTQAEADDLRSKRNKVSKQIGALMGQGKKEEAEKVKAEVAAINARIAELEPKEAKIADRIREIMLVIPNMIDPSVPIGPDDSCNVEIERFGEPVVPDFEIPYHTEIMERFNGIDMDAAGKVAGNGFYYLLGALHDPFQRRHRRHEFPGDGSNDVQDRGRGSVPDRYLRAFHDRPLHRYSER